MRCQNPTQPVVVRLRYLRQIRSWDDLYPQDRDAIEGLFEERHERVVLRLETPSSGSLPALDVSAKLRMATHAEALMDVEARARVPVESAAFTSELRRQTVQGISLEERGLLRGALGWLTKEETGGLSVARVASLRVRSGVESVAIVARAVSEILLVADARVAEACCTAGLEDPALCRGFVAAGRAWTPGPPATSKALLVLAVALSIAKPTEIVAPALHALRTGDLPRLRAIFDDLLVRNERVMDTFSGDDYSFLGNDPPGSKARAWAASAMVKGALRLVAWQSRGRLFAKNQEVVQGQAYLMLRDLGWIMPVESGVGSRGLPRTTAETWEFVHRLVYG